MVKDTYTKLGSNLGTKYSRATIWAPYQQNKLWAFQSPPEAILSPLKLSQFGEFESIQDQVSNFTFQDFDR